MNPRHHQEPTAQRVIRRVAHGEELIGMARKEPLRVELAMRQNPALVDALPLMLRQTLTRMVGV